MENSKSMEYDHSDLFSRPTENQFQVSPIQPLERIEVFLDRALQQDLLPKSDVRRVFTNAKSDRERLVKQFSKAIESIQYWIAKRKLLKQQLNHNREVIESFGGQMLAVTLN